MVTQVATDADLMLEVADLTRKLATAQALLSYQQRRAETAQLEAEQEKRKIRTQLALLEVRYKQLSIQRAENERYISELEDAIVDAEVELERSETELQTVAEKLQRDETRLEATEEHVRTLETNAKASNARLASENSTLSLTLTQLQTEHKTLQERLNSFEYQLEQMTSKKLETESKVATQNQEIASLQKEAETKLAKCVEDYESRITVLESQLQATRAKLKSFESNGTKVPFEANTRKRSIEQNLTMEDLERTAKKPRKKIPKTSEFSVTPFLKKQAQALPSSSSDPSCVDTSDQTRAEECLEDPGEKSIMISSVTESNKPTRLLLAGAFRNRKPKASAEPIPALEEEHEGDSITVAGLPLQGENRGRAPATSKRREPSLELDPLSDLEEPPSKPKVKVKTQAPAPAKSKNREPSLELEKEKPFEKPMRKSKRPAETGIKPTLFADDDGTGRLTLDIDVDSQPQTKGKAAARPRKPPGIKVVGGGKLGSKLLDSGEMAPVVSAFNKEFSPAKKRPDALRKLFGGK